jgi:threonine dehydratase
MTMLDIADINAARAYLAARVHRTPVLTSRTLDGMTGATLFLKPEALQRTGSFKVRGVLKRLRSLNDEERRRGLITISAGNHAQAVAYAATAEGVHATVVMPEHASPSKVEACRSYGAEVILHGDIFGAFAHMDELRQVSGAVLIHPFDDPAVMAGQGTAVAELLEDAPDLDAVIVPVGGGGLLSGTAVAVKSMQPRARVIGVEPVGSAAVRRGLEAGHPVRLERSDTIADGLGAPATGENVLEHVRALVDDMVLVTDDDIFHALRLLLERCKLLAEPAGAAALAALLSGTARSALPARDNLRIGVIISGGNFDLQRLQALLQHNGTGGQA